MTEKAYQSKQSRLGKVRERTRESIKKNAPKVKSGLIAAGKTARAIGWELFKQTKAGKKFERKRKKGVKVLSKATKKKKGFHKECKWVKD